MLRAADMARRCPPAPTYRRPQPEQTVLYRTIAAHLPAFLARTVGEDGTGGWPAFVRREFEAYLRCGRLEHGFVRAQCERCGDTIVVAFSCKGRGVCPSCGGRRMSELAAHLVDHVLPAVPIRQWVFTVPVPVRSQLAFDAGLTRAVLRVFLRTVFGWQRRRAARRGLVGARSGSVTAIQRCGGAANLNLHFHALLFDGVYTRATPTARPVFHRLPPPTDADIVALLTRLQRRVQRLLLRRGRCPDVEADSDPLAVQAPLFAQAVAASLQGRVALGPRAGSRCGGCARRPTRSRPGGARPGWRASACMPTSRCRSGGGISWNGCVLCSAPAAGAGAADRELGRAAPVSVPPGLERRLHGAPPRSPGTARTVSRPRAAAAAALGGVLRPPGAARPVAIGDRPEAVERRAPGRGDAPAAALAVGALAPARVRR